MSDLPDLDQDDIESIFDELAGMDVQLDPDPLEHGPKRLREKVAETREVRSRCEALFQRISRQLFVYRREHRREETKLSIGRQRLLAEDFEVRSGPSVADREARATLKLHSQVLEEARLSQCIAELEAVLTVIKAKRSDLMDIRTQLKSQERLCLEEIQNLNGQWGSRPPPGERGVDLSKGGPAIQPNDLDKFLQDILGGETHLPPADFEVEEEEVSETSEEEDTSSSPKEEEPLFELPVVGKVDSTEILPATVSEDEVDQFLQGSMPEPEVQKGGPEDPDIDIEALLETEP